jgi:hypothetical protein
MPASNTPLLASPAEVRRRPGSAGLAGDARDALLVQLLRGASQAFRSQTKQEISRVVDDVEFVDPEGSGVLLLKQLPVVDVAEIMVDGVSLPPAGMWNEHGIIRRAGGRFPRAFRSVRVTYTHGYDPVPADVVDAVVERVLIASRGPGGMSQAAAGPFQATYQLGSTQLWTDAVATYRRHV